MRGISSPIGSINYSKLANKLLLTKLGGENSCKGCYFDTFDLSCTDKDDQCVKVRRMDNKPTIFVEVEISLFLKEYEKRINNRED